MTIRLGGWRGSYIKQMQQDLNMASFWSFKKFRYFASGQLLIREDGSKVQLRPKAAALLSLLLSRQREAVTYSEAIDAIWGVDSEKIPHDLQSLKYELDLAFKGDSPVKGIRGQGYVFDDYAEFSDESLNPRRSLAAIHVFPGAAPVAGDFYLHSWVGYGERDYVESITQTLAGEMKPRSLALLSLTEPSTLVIPFQHVSDLGDPANSWWALVLALAVNPTSGRWLPVDLSHYRALRFEASVVPAENCSLPIALKVRLEDDSTEAEGGSYRQSTSWHRKLISLVDHFRTFELELDGFDWTREGWPAWNTKDPDRSGIAQLVFEQDHETRSAAGVIRLKNIEFLP